MLAPTNRTSVCCSRSSRFWSPIHSCRFLAQSAKKTLSDEGFLKNSITIHVLVYLSRFPFLMNRDEVGHTHPTQLAALNKESDLDDASNPDGLKFWHSDHKLAISTEILFQLYKQAKGAFFDTIAQYKMHCNLMSRNEDDNSVHCYSEHHNTLENDVLKHSRTLLLLSSDFGTAWNSRLYFYILFLTICTAMIKWIVGGTYHFGVIM